MSDLYVQYGCGFSAPAGWVNFDASPTLRLERIPWLGRLHTRKAQRFPPKVRYGDIVAGLPLADGSCRGLYCAHVLEHLALEDAHTALRHTFRYLAAGGTFRLVTPDLAELARDYLADGTAEAAHAFMDVSGLGQRHRPRGPEAWLAGPGGTDAHRWLWDEAAMAAALRQHGFTQVRRCAFGDAADPRFAEVEAADRFAGCLAMEGRK